MSDQPNENDPARAATRTGPETHEEESPSVTTKDATRGTRRLQPRLRSLPATALTDLHADVVRALDSMPRSEMSVADLRLAGQLDVLEAIRSDLEAKNRFETACGLPPIDSQDLANAERVEHMQSCLRIFLRSGDPDARRKLMIAVGVHVVASLVAAGRAAADDPGVGHVETILAPAQQTVDSFIVIGRGSVPTVTLTDEQRDLLRGEVERQFDNDIEGLCAQDPVIGRLRRRDAITTMFGVLDDLGWDEDDIHNELTLRPGLGTWLRESLDGLRGALSDSRGQLDEVLRSTPEFLAYNWGSETRCEDLVLDITTSIQRDEFEEAAWLSVLELVGEPADFTEDEQLVRDEIKAARDERHAERMRSEGFIQRPDGEWFRPERGAA